MLFGCPILRSFTNRMFGESVQMQDQEWKEDIRDFANKMNREVLDDAHARQCAIACIGVSIEELEKKLSLRSIPQAPMKEAKFLISSRPISKVDIAKLRKTVEEIQVPLGAYVLQSKIIGRLDTKQLITAKTEELIEGFELLDEILTLLENNWDGLKLTAWEAIGHILYDLLSGIPVSTTRKLYYMKHIMAYKHIHD